MKQKLTYLIIIFLLISSNGHCQFLNNTIIRTRPLQDFAGKNPNIGIELPINKKFSLEFDGMYRNRTWYSTGGEWDFGWFFPSKGFRVLSGFRGYFPKNKNAPFGWFWGTQLVTKYSQLENINIKEFSGMTIYTQDIQILQLEIIPVIGYQFQYFNRISTEFYIGPNFVPYRSEKTVIVDCENPDLMGQKDKEVYGFVTLEFTISIGIVINKKQNEL